MLSSFLKSLVILLTFSLPVLGQAGITTSPPRLFFRVPPGGTGIQKVVVSNPLSKELEVGISYGDWDYDMYGSNRLHDVGALKTSCADWIRVLPGSFFSLLPDERKELTVELTVPANADQSVPVHTSMMYFTQLNTSNSKNSKGAAIKVSVRMGVKIYHSFSASDEREVEIADFLDTRNDKDLKSPGFLEIHLENTGKLWIDGKVKWDLLNVNSGEKIKLEDTDLLALPGDKRVVRKELPATLKKGKYSVTAVINYGSKDQLKVVELEFER